MSVIWRAAAGFTRRRAGCRIAITILALWMVVPVEAEIYQWRDASGRVHFGDKKPAAADTEVVSRQVTEVNTDESAAERKKLERLFKAESAAERAHRQRQEVEQRRNQAERERQCEQARRQLELLQGPVYFTREDGSSFSISESERERRAFEMAGQLAIHCDF